MDAAFFIVAWQTVLAIGCAIGIYCGLMEVVKAIVDFKIYFIRKDAEKENDE